MTERRRWAVFSRSIISAVGNPDAYLMRALGGFLANLGDEATFFEERANPALRAMLVEHGAAAMTAFRLRYPNLAYRTIDPRSGADLVEWLTRTLSTVDIAVVLHQAPAELTRWVGFLTRPHLVTAFVDPGIGEQIAEAALREREISAFTGIWIGNPGLRERYLAVAPADQVHDFGPVPPVETEDAGEAVERLRAAAVDLAEQIAGLAARE